MLATSIGHDIYTFSKARRALLTTISQTDGKEGLSEHDKAKFLRVMGIQTTNQAYFKFLDWKAKNLEELCSEYQRRQTCK